MKELTLFAICLSAVEFASAQQSAAFFPERKSFINLHYVEFSGEEFKSFGKNTSAFGGEIQLRAGNSAFGFMTSTAGYIGSGTESIMDSTTERSLNIELMMVDVNAGFYINLMPSKDFPLRPYVGVMGTAEFVNLKLPTSVDYTELDATENQMLTGYQVSIGADLMTNRKDQQSRYSLNVEARYRFIGGELVKEDKFRLDGLTLILGFGF